MWDDFWKSLTGGIELYGPREKIRNVAGDIAAVHGCRRSAACRRARPGSHFCRPFLTGRSVSYVKSWAEAKMHRGGAPAPSAPAVETKNVARTSPEFIAYKAAITTLVTAMMEPVAPG
jgi:hypothetical protein